MRFVTLVLTVLLALVHAELWLGHGGMPRERELSARLRDQRMLNEQARSENLRLAAEVRDLREGLEIIEEKARGELGMVKTDELLVRYTTTP
jgi:cell division protein FtsB